MRTLFALLHLSFEITRVWIKWPTPAQHELLASALLLPLAYARDKVIRASDFEMDVVGCVHINDLVAIDVAIHIICCRDRFLHLRSKSNPRIFLEFVRNPGIKRYHGTERFRREEAGLREYLLCMLEAEPFNPFV